MDAQTPQTTGVVAVIPEQGRLLVIRRSQMVVAPRLLCFPGGGIHAGESEETALRREIDEELGISVIPVRRIWESVTPWNVPLAWWLARREGEAPIIPNPNEVESVQWLTPDALVARPDLLESNRQFLGAWSRDEFLFRVEEF